MRRFGIRDHFMVALLALAFIFTMPGVTALAGTMGVGAAGKDKKGPGVVTQVTDSGSQENTGQQSQDGQTQQNSGQGQSQGTQQVPAGSVPILSYGVFLRGQGWNDSADQNRPVQAQGASWVTAMRASLSNIPDGVSLGVSYQANLSGSGWLEWTADGQEMGKSAGEMPLEALRMQLKGANAGSYDLYYRVLQNGGWTEWSLNGAAAGQEGAGLRIDGLRAAVVTKGAEAPADISSSVNPSRPMIALTFDDGPRTAVTSRILDSLQANGGKATFFMVGSNVMSNQDVIRRMAAQGCEVANHTNDHKYISKIGADGIVSQVGGTNQKVQSVCGVAPVVMRPPGGYYDAGSLAVLAQMGMPAIMWSIDTRDWQHRNAQKTIDTVLSQVKDGDIILMHDIYGTTADAAVVLIPKLTAMGYQLVTVSELAAFRGGMNPGQVYSRFRP